MKTASTGAGARPTWAATATHAAPDDFGAFITSAEWLDVNYGSLVRELLLDGLGGTAIHVVEPTALPFADAATTAAITCFRLGARPKTILLRRVKSVAQLGHLDQGQAVRRERLVEARRWTPLMPVISSSSSGCGSNSSTSSAPIRAAIGLARYDAHGGGCLARRSLEERDR